MTALLLALLFAAPERVVMVAKPAGPPGIFSRVRGSVRGCTGGRMTTWRTATLSQPEMIRRPPCASTIAPERGCRTIPR